MTIPHFAVVGRSETGKTSLVVKLIEELRDKGYAVASVKHTKGKFELDSKETDTYKHGESGSEMVVFSTPLETSFIFKNGRSMEDILSIVEKIREFDVLVIEGMKEGNLPKISTDKDVGGDIYYDDNYDEVVNWVEKKIELFRILDRLPMKNCGECGYQSCQEFAEGVYKGEVKLEDCRQLISESIKITVNDEEISLGRFPSNIIKNSILGMMKSLKGVEDIEKVEIYLEDKEN